MIRRLRGTGRKLGRDAISAEPHPAHAAGGAAPATTALGTISPNGREEGAALWRQRGDAQPFPQWACEKKYMLYDNKICTGHEAAECAGCLNVRVASVGMELAVDRGDHIHYKASKRICIIRNQNVQMILSTMRRSWRHWLTPRKQGKPGADR